MNDKIKDIVVTLVFLFTIISLFLIKDQLVDSLDLQKKLFNKMTVENKESNIYKVLESKLK